MNVTIERTEEEVILRFPASTSYKEMKQELEYLEFVEIASKIDVGKEDADALLRSIKKGIGRRTRKFLADKPGFEHLTYNEEE
jgi:hypothetical protein